MLEDRTFDRINRVFAFEKKRSLAVLDTIGAGAVVKGKVSSKAVVTGVVKGKVSSKEADRRRLSLASSAGGSVVDDEAQLPLTESASKKGSSSGASAPALLKEPPPNQKMALNLIAHANILTLQHVLRDMTVEGVDQNKKKALLEHSTRMFLVYVVGEYEQAI